ncbi:MAG: hypothetical protein NVSMB2_10470 [Chloroflexota bacterium]
MTGANLTASGRVPKMVMTFNIGRQIVAAGPGGNAPCISWDRMRGTERIILVIAIAVPLVIALVGWPLFMNWLGQPASASPPPVVGNAATAEATGRSGQPTRTPTPVVFVAGVAVTPTAGRTAAAAAPAPARSPTPTAPRAGAPTAVLPATPEVASRAVAVSPESPQSPDEAVATFYGLVSSHQFDTAANLWSEHMRIAFPVAENINSRFAQTQSIQLQRADVVNRTGSQATVAVELTEVTTNGQRRYVGTWQLVRGANGWLLDQPNLQAAG